MNTLPQTEFHICMNMYEIWTYTGRHTYTRPRRYKSPGSRERERKLGCEEMTQMCRCVLLNRSFSPSLFSFFYFFFLLYSFDILMDLSSCGRKKSLRNLKGWSNCVTALRLILLSETQLKVSLWLKGHISLFMLVTELSMVISSLIWGTVPQQTH